MAQLRRAPRVLLALGLALECTACAANPAVTASVPPSLAAPALTPSPSAVAPTPAPATPAPLVLTPAPSAGRLSVVVVGDSIPYGQEDCGGCESFPSLFADWITQATGRSVLLSNLSRHDDYTAARMAVDLPGSATAAVIQDADVIVVTIGHNDTPWNATDDACDANHGPLDGYPGASWSVYQGACVTTEVNRFRANMTTILGTIVALRAGKPTAFRITTQYDDLLADPTVPSIGKQLSIPVKTAYNAAACDVAQQFGFVCVDVYRAFNGPNGDASPGDLLAADITHPSAKGHELIAQLLEQAGLAPIADVSLASPEATPP